MAGPRRKGSGPVGTFVTTFLLVIAIGVFAFAAWKLVGYYLAYKAGADEYDSLRRQTVQIDGRSEEDEARPEETDGDGSGSPAAEESGRVLTSVEELEDPETVEEVKAQAQTARVTENQEVKVLPRMKNPINFAELTAINSDIIGWVRVGAVEGISYPIAQARDNDYYLHRTFRGEENFAGCIFLNCYNTRYLTDQNTIVYGHNMKDGSMFGSLKNLKKQETYESNPYFWIFTPELIYQYRIFSAATVSYDAEVYLTRFTTEDFGSFLERCRAASEIRASGKAPGTGDRVVTLSTCTGDYSTRFVVQGVLEQVYASV